MYKFIPILREYGNVVEAVGDVRPCSNCEWVWNQDNFKQGN